MTDVDPLIQQIERVRKQRRITTSALAADAGISRSTFDHARRGRYGITMHTLRALADALGLEIRLAPVVVRDLGERFDAPKPTPAPVTPAQAEQHRKALGAALDPRWRGRPA